MTTFAAFTRYTSSRNSLLDVRASLFRIRPRFVSQWYVRALSVNGTSALCQASRSPGACKGPLFGTTFGHRHDLVAAFTEVTIGDTIMASEGVVHNFILVCTAE